MGQTVFEDLVVRGVKLLDIGVSTLAYFVMALVCIVALNKFRTTKGSVDEEKKSVSHLMFEIITRAWLIGVAAYLARNLWTAIPFPLEGVCGYKHLKTGEVTGSAVFVAFAVTYDTQLQDKVKTLKAKMNL